MESYIDIIKKIIPIIIGCLFIYFRGPLSTLIGLFLAGNKYKPPFQDDVINETDKSKYRERGNLLFGILLIVAGLYSLVK